MAGGKDIDVNLNLTAKAKGFREAQRETQKLAQDLTPEKLTSGFKQLDHFMSQSVRQFRGLERHVKNMNQQFAQFSRSLAGMEKAATAMEKMAEAAEKIRSPGGAGGGAGAGAPGAPGVLGPGVQGFLQGVGGPGFSFLQREGGARQFAGQMAGRTLGGVGRAGIGATFSGVGGLAQGLAGIPVVGGFMAGQMQTMAAAANEFTQFQRQQVGLAPFIGAGALSQRRMAAEAAAAAGARIRDARFRRFTAEEAVRKLRPGGAEAETAAGLELAGRTGATAVSGVGDLGTEVGRAMVREGVTVLSPKQQKLVADQVVAENRRRSQAMEKQAVAAENAARTRVMRGAAPTGLGTLRRVGAGLGFTSQEALQFGGQFMGAAGGTLGERSEADVRAAFAAQRAFGVQAGVSGAVLRGERRGGIVGVREMGGGAFIADVLEQAMKAGMDKSEAASFLGEIAQGQQRFLQTGIPINPRTITELTKGFRMAGLEQGRALRLGGALTGRAQQISAQGPQTAADFLMLQQVGGFTGGGLEDLERAELALEQADFTGEEFQGFIRQILEGAGGGAAGRRALRNVFAGMGAQIGVQEAQALAFQATGEGPVDEEALKRAREGLRLGAAQAPMGLTGLEQQARDVVGALGSSLRAQVTMEEKRLEIGGKMVTTMKDLEISQLNVSSAFSVLAAEAQPLVGTITQLTSNLPALVEAMLNAMKRLDLVPDQ